MVMYGIYNLDTLVKLIDLVHKNTSKTTWNEKLFMGKLDDWHQWYLTKGGVQHYVINSLLNMTTVREKCVIIYEMFISQLQMYANPIGSIKKGYFPTSLLPPPKVQEILKEVKKAIQISNPDYDVAINILHLFYDMKLVTFGINKERNLIVQFSVFVQPYTQQQLILYQFEMASVPIIDQNKQAHFYTHLQVGRPHIAFNSETYISLRHQELRTCKNIGYEFYCKELFVVKHKSKYSLESAIYINLGSESLWKIAILHIILTIPISNLHFMMVENTLYWQTGPTINTLNVISIMIFQSKYPAPLMFRSTDNRGRKIIFFWNHWLCVMMQNLNWYSTSQ